MESDDELERDVADDLRWYPDTDEAHGVATAKDGVRGRRLWTGTVRAPRLGSR